MPKHVILYSCNVEGDGFVVSKFIDEDYKTHYHVLNSKSQTYCDCLGYANHGKCRHLTITSKFIQENKVGKGYLYNFDKEEFTQLSEQLLEVKD